MRYHLWFVRFSQNGPHGVLDSGAVTGADPACPLLHHSGSGGCSKGYSPSILSPVSPTRRLSAQDLPSYSSFSSHCANFSIIPIICQPFTQLNPANRLCLLPSFQCRTKILQHYTNILTAYHGVDPATDQFGLRNPVNPLFLRGVKCHIDRRD